MTFKEENKLHSYLVEYFTIKCKCGHSVLVLQDKNICSYCGYYVFKDKPTEFKYRMKEHLNNVSNRK